MKHILSLLSLVFVASALACAPVHESPPPPLAEHATFERTIHVDSRASELAERDIVDAARAWRDISGGRISLHPVFDLDPETLDGVLSDPRGAALVASESDEPLGQAVRSALGPDAMAGTFHTRRGPILVVLLLDRIPVSRFRTVVAHELGHVAHLPDLPAYGSLMSGVDRVAADPVIGVTPADVALCRGLRYCD